MSNDNSEYLSGGTLRVSTRSDTENLVNEAAPITDSSRVYVSDNSVSVMTDVVPGGGVMASARSSTGSARIDDSTTVDVGGMRTDLKTAEGLGLIRRGANGSWEDVHGMSPTSQPEQQQQASDLTAPEHFAPHLEKEFADLIEPVSQHAYDSAIAMAAVAVTDPSEKGWEKMQRSLVQDSGMEPTQAADYIESAYAVFENQVALEVNKMGIDANSKETFYAFCQSKPSELTRATQALTTTRRLDGFRDLAVQYMKQTNTAAMPAWRAAGFENVYLDEKTGDLMVGKKGQGVVRAKDLK